MENMTSGIAPAEEARTERGVSACGRISALLYRVAPYARFCLALAAAAVQLVTFIVAFCDLQVNIMSSHAGFQPAMTASSGVNILLFDALTLMFTARTEMFYEEALVAPYIAVTVIGFAACAAVLVMLVLMLCGLPAFMRTRDASPALRKAVIAVCAEGAYLFTASAVSAAYPAGEALSAFYPTFTASLPSVVGVLVAVAALALSCALARYDNGARKATAKETSETACTLFLTGISLALLSGLRMSFFEIRSEAHAIICIITIVMTIVTAYLLIVSVCFALMRTAGGTERGMPEALRNITISASVLLLLATAACGIMSFNVALMLMTARVLMLGVTGAVFAISAAVRFTRREKLSERIDGVRGKFITVCMTLAAIVVVIGMLTSFCTFMDISGLTGGTVAVTTVGAGLPAAPYMCFTLMHEAFPDIPELMSVIVFGSFAVTATLLLGKFVSGAIKAVPSAVVGRCRELVRNTISLIALAAVSVAVMGTLDFIVDTGYSGGAAFIGISAGTGMTVCLAIAAVLAGAGGAAYVLRREAAAHVRALVCGVLCLCSFAALCGSNTYMLMTVSDVGSGGTEVAVPPVALTSVYSFVAAISAVLTGSSAFSCLSRGVTGRQALPLLSFAASAASLAAMLVMAIVMAARYGEAEGSLAALASPIVAAAFLASAMIVGIIARKTVVPPRIAEVACDGE